MLVTDTAYLRGYMRECYHNTCDSLNNTNLSQENLDFLSSITTALVKAVAELSSEQPSLVRGDPDPVVVEANTLDVNQGTEEDRDVPGPGRNNNYENVQTQINIENLHLTIAGPPSPGLQGEEGYFYIDPAMAKIKQIIRQFYKREDGDDSLNSPIIIKVENDL